MAVAHPSTSDNDEEIWVKYPRLHRFFNKLWIAECFNYRCGPACVPVPETAEYIVRPIYNLHGMGWGSRFVKIKGGETGNIPPGYFWCEKLQGEHCSVDFVDDKPILTVKGETDGRPGHFVKWTRLDEHHHKLPDMFRGLGMPVINIEFIGNSPIEIHFRRNTDFEGHNFKELVVHWENDHYTGFKMRKTHTWIENEEKAEFDIRAGFWAR